MKCEYPPCIADAATRRYCSRPCNTKHRIHKTRQAKKTKAVQYLGGKCLRCGYDKSVKALQFHHRDPATKLTEIAKMIRDWMPWNLIQQELDKCDLLCANCHAEIEWNAAGNGA